MPYELPAQKVMPMSDVDQKNLDMARVSLSLCFRRRRYPALLLSSVYCTLVAVQYYDVQKKIGEKRKEETQKNPAGDLDS